MYRMTLQEFSSQISSLEQLVLRTSLPIAKCVTIDDSIRQYGFVPPSHTCTVILEVKELFA